MNHKTTNIITVGSGIAAWCLHLELSKLKNTTITNISANDFFAPCSENSTAINCLRGTRANVSELGDLIRLGMSDFEKAHHLHNFKSVTKGVEYQVLEEKTRANWLRRYPEFFNIEADSFLANKIQGKTLFYPVEAYFINQELLKKELCDLAPKVIYKTALVQNIKKLDDRYEVEFQGQSAEADIVVLCCGHSTTVFKEVFTEDFKTYLSYTKPVSGGYLELKQASSHGLCFERSFNIRIEKHHFIYRNKENIVQIGSTSFSENTFEIAKDKDLKRILNECREFFKFDLPEYNAFTKKTGIRHKGRRRTPYWDSVDGQSMYAICGLYKNAFSFSFTAAKAIASKIKC